MAVPNLSRSRRSRRPCGSIRLRRDPTTNPRLRLPGLPRLPTTVVDVVEAHRSRGQSCSSCCASARRNRDHPSQSVPSHLPQPRAPKRTAWLLEVPRKKEGAESFLPTLLPTRAVGLCSSCRAHSRRTTLPGSPRLACAAACLWLAEPRVLCLATPRTSRVLPWREKRKKKAMPLRLAAACS